MGLIIIYFIGCAITLILGAIFPGNDFINTTLKNVFTCNIPDILIMYGIGTLLSYTKRIREDISNSHQNSIINYLMHCNDKEFESFYENSTPDDIDNLNAIAENRYKFGYSEKTVEMYNDTSKIVDIEGFGEELFKFSKQDLSILSDINSLKSYYESTYGYRILFTFDSKAKTKTVHSIEIKYPEDKYYDKFYKTDSKIMVDRFFTAIKKANEEYSS